MVKGEDPMDGSTQPLSDDELRRIRNAVKWVESAKPILNPQVVLVTNWKAWAFGLSMLAYIRSAEIGAFISAIAGVER